MSVFTTNAEHHALWQQLPESQLRTWQLWKELDSEFNQGVLLTRHSVRDLTDAHGNSGYALPLNSKGVELALCYGNWVSEHMNFSTLISSPVQRCIHTAELMTGAAPATADWLKEPGAFVDKNPELAQCFFKVGHHAFAQQLLSNTLPTKLSVNQAAQRLLGRLYQHCFVERTGAALAVTHDTVLSVLYSYLSGADFVSEANWPQMMEGGVMVAGPTQFEQLIFRGKVYPL